MTSWETTRISDSRSDSELATTTLNIKYSKKSILGAICKIPTLHGHFPCPFRATQALLGLAAAALGIPICRRTSEADGLWNEISLHGSLR